jgi:hypothetical protein
LKQRAISTFFGKRWTTFAGGIPSENRTVNLREFWREAVERRPRAVIQILTDVHQQSCCCILGGEQGGGRHVGKSLRGQHLGSSSPKNTSLGLPLLLSRHFEIADYTFFSEIKICQAESNDTLVFGF